MTTKPLDFTRPVKLRCGWKAEIVHADMGGSEPLLVVYTTARGELYPRKYRLDGLFFANSEHPFDLIQDESEPRRGEVVRWYNVYENGSFDYKDRATADEYACPSRVARIRHVFSWTEGQFDEEPEA